ncbi:MULTISPECIES: ribosomal protein S18-alanine N-acetyltransferase [Leuconostoc]|uniref:Ribosomal-protein-alanine N-acetyltransferase n=1 Tax=Leuconostoc pseudomesenteroides TaxID=33968 RepID=A0A1X0VDC0_LEUPS|nr:MULTISPECIES: ribosomal protein S18-alanine N-acetyltransferase [Leuconostoc]KDA48008.1 Ribosomal-protein-S18p-alanine acetyltransferase [Leuconostoc pseudomesenteroides 1159]KDA49604.1 Ribosomal-protein-S18p-alanine acetyltransferase [Leuconostoc pseudomesenteroides PS12]CCJ66984.1 Ribosomal-protein-S18p-alanine acetyltransferase [Leuconostoc pseudomesenteroides 4882]MCT4419513.1 ribosomal-protein-alanine N-acetyltransferase [Leuconostoc falkenbergense]MDG9744754.1 ribosomal protein S18-al
MFLKFKRQQHLPFNLPKFEARQVEINGISFALRRATLKDIDILIKIEEAVYEGVAPWLLRDFMSELSRPHIRLYLVVERRGQIIAFAGAAYRSDIDDMHITNIAVVPVWQKHGIGTMLLESIHEFAHNMHMSTMTLEARRSNTNAQTLYRKLGYEQTEIKKGYYLGDHEDAVSMTLNFDNQTGNN